MLQPLHRPRKPKQLPEVAARAEARMVRPGLAWKSMTSRMWTSPLLQCRGRAWNPPRSSWTWKSLTSREVAWKSPQTQLEVESQLAWKSQLQVVTLQLAWKSQLQVVAQVAWKSQLQASGLEKPNVIIDWHFTLEVNDQVPDDNIKAVRALMEKSNRVTLLSYVASNQRAQQVQQDMQNLLPADIYRRLGKAICWKKVGPAGMIAKRFAKNACSGIWRYIQSEILTRSMGGQIPAMRPSQKLSQAICPTTLSCEIHSMLGKALGDPCNWWGRRGAWKSSPPEAWKSFCIPGKSRDWLGKVNPSVKQWAWKSPCLRGQQCMGLEKLVQMCMCESAAVQNKTTYRQLCLCFSAASQQQAATMYRQAAGLEKLAAQEVFLNTASRLGKVCFSCCVWVWLVKVTSLTQEQK